MCDCFIVLKHNFIKYQKLKVPLGFYSQITWLKYKAQPQDAFVFPFYLQSLVFKICFSFYVSAFVFWP